MSQAIIHPEILERYPHYSGVVLYAKNLENRASDATSSALLERAEIEARATFLDGKASEHPHIVAWRNAFQNFGVKPSKMLCSAEALISRVLKGNELPRINWLTDVYNSMSVRYVLPIGGEDWDAAVGSQQLKLADGSELFDTVKDGAPFTDHPQAGEVVWTDDAGVTCRAWNWRQCVRTRLTQNTKNAYFVLDSLEPNSTAKLLEAANDLENAINTNFPSCELERVLIGRVAL
jgi:DNA/RNA-binding domain of Phe-tRNA-synthetase-like protein